MALFPMVEKSKKGLAYTMQPKFTQFWGVICQNFSPLPLKQLSFEKKCIGLIANKLKDKFRLVQFNLSPNFTYQLPLQWAGFTIQNKYTYHIDLSLSTHEVLANFDTSIRSNIKAEHPDLITECVKDPSEVIALYKSEKDTSKFDANDWSRLSDCITLFAEKGQAETIQIRKGKTVISAMTFLKYKSHLIYFFGTTKKEERHTGAMSKIIWHAIERHHHNCDIFDFEGSVLEQLESFARKFNSYPVPYGSVSHENLPFPIRILKKLKAK